MAIGSIIFYSTLDKKPVITDCFGDVTIAQLDRATAF